MKITHAHKDFWAYHRGPAWIRDYSKNKPDVPMPSDRSVDPNFCNYNLMNLLRRTPRGGRKLRQRLITIIHNPGTIIRPKRRAATARKWYKKLEGVK